MEFDWLDVNFDLSKVPPKEIEESFEDPFAVKLVPTDDYPIEDSRYFCLGKSVSEILLLSLFWTNGIWRAVDSIAIAGTEGIPL